MPRPTQNLPLADKIVHMLESTGRKYTSEGIAGIMQRSPVGIRMTLGRIGGRNANIKYDIDNNGNRHWYFAKGETKITTGTDEVTELAQQMETETLPALTSDWHPTNTFERAVIKRLADRGKINGEFANRRAVKVSYLKDGNFTVALVKAGGRFYAGVAKRNPTDRDDEEIGTQIAFSRAIRNQPLGI